MKRRAGTRRGHHPGTRPGADPALSTRHSPCITVHIYSQDPRGALSQVAGLGRRLCEQHDAGKGRLVWFLPRGSDPDPGAACTRIQMRTFGPGQPATAPRPTSTPADASLRLSPPRSSSAWRTG
jgi:hypothetical protein